MKTSLAPKALRAGNGSVLLIKGLDTTVCVLEFTQIHGIPHKRIMDDP